MKNFYFNFLLVLFLFYFVSFSSSAATYYVSVSGNNSKSGTSISNAWATLDKVNSKSFLPGDVVLLEGGATFNGNLYFDQNDAGNAAAPIIVGSYGNGRATINSDKTFGIFIYNMAGIEINNIIVKGSGRTTNEDIGISFYNDVPNTLLDHVVIDNVEVYGYRTAGIMFGSELPSTGYSNFKVINSIVHDNASVGIASYSDGTMPHKNVYIGNTKVYNNSGISAITYIHTGNGIMLSGVDGALVEYCEAYNNGWLNGHQGGGPVGIWGYICNNLVIQYNESHHNKTGTTKDGGGFDLDGGCTNSIMQYNYSHDNDGAGYLLAQYDGAPEMKNLIIRYNISENDGRKNSNAGILLWATNSNGGIQDADIYNNTIYLSPASSGSPIGVHVSSSYIKNTKVRNNIVQTTGGLLVVRAQSNNDIRFEGNAYWSTGSPLKFYWVGTTYSSLENWRSGTNQEKLNNEPMGFNVNPELTEPGKGITLGDPSLLHTLTGYQLRTTSNLIDKGLDLAKVFGLNIGEIDFWRNKLDQQASFSVGAHQFQPIPAAKIAQTINFSAILDQQYGAAPLALQASASSGLPVEFKVISGPATLSQNTLTLTGTGVITLEASQTGDNTYTAAPVITQTLKVAKAAQQITFAAVTDKIMGAAPFALMASASSGLPISFEVKSGPATLAGNIVTLTGTGSVIISATQSGSDAYLPAESVNQSFAVSSLILNQTITFSAIAPKIYGNEFDLEATATSGLPVSFRIVSGPATLIQNRLKTTGSGIIIVEASQGGNNTYTAAPVVSQSITVNKAPQEILFAPLADKIFGTGSFSLSATASSNLPISFSVVSGPATISGNVLTLTGAGIVNIRATQAGSTNYLAAANVERSFTVNAPAKQNQTIAFTALGDKTFGDAPISLSATATSGLPVSFQLVSGPATLNGNVLTLNGTGALVVRALQAGNDTYHAANPVDRSFTIKKASQTISFVELTNKTYGDESFSIAANASSGLPVSFSIVNGPATIAGNMVTLTGAGTVTIEAAQAGNTLHAAATAVTQSFSVGKAAQVISFKELENKKVADAAFALAATSSNATLPVIFISSNPEIVSVANTNGKWMATILATGQVDIVASQAGNDKFLAAADVVRSLTIQANPSEVSLTPVLTEERLKIVSVNASKNTGVDYTPWLNDDLNNIVKKVWQPNNNKWVDVTLQLEHRSTVNRISLYDFEGIFTVNPAEIYAVNGSEITFLGLFKGEDYKKWVNLPLKEPIIADAILIRKYSNNIPQKINVYGKVIEEIAAASESTKEKKNALKSISWSAYPNPTTDKLQVELDPELKGQVTIDLMNATGHQLQHIDVKNNSTNSIQTLSLEKLQNGLYFLYLKVNGVIEVKKIYKQ